jgi:hypothetical protein
MLLGHNVCSLINAHSTFKDQGLISLSNESAFEIGDQITNFMGKGENEIYVDDGTINHSSSMFT